MHLDVRCKFILMIISSIASFSAYDIYYGNFVFCIVALLCLLLGEWRKVLRFGVVYAGVVVFILFSAYLPTAVRSLILLIAMCMRMCMPLFMYGQVFLNTSSVSEMVTGMYSMKIPRAFVISFAVVMRFFPTAKEEIQSLRDAMALRGISFSLKNLLKRPMVILEGLMAPLLIRASLIAEELSAASITRGLDNPNPRTAFIKLHITALDVLITLLFVSALCGIVVWKMVAGG